MITGTCFIQKIYATSSSLLQGKHLPFTPSPLRLNIFHLFVILSLTQLYRYTPEIFLFSTATFKYKYRAPLRRIGPEYSAKVAFSIFQSPLLKTEWKVSDTGSAHWASSFFVFFLCLSVLKACSTPLTHTHTHTHTFRSTPPPLLIATRYPRRDIILLRKQWP